MRNSTFQVDFTICFSLFLPTSLLVVLFFFYLSLFSAQLHFLPAVLEQLTQFQIAFSSPCPCPLGVLLLPMTPLHLSLSLSRCPPLEAVSYLHLPMHMSCTCHPDWDSPGWSHATSPGTFSILFLLIKGKYLKCYSFPLNTSRKDYSLHLVYDHYLSILYSFSAIAIMVSGPLCFIFKHP